MATNNAVNNSLTGQTGTGLFVGSISPSLTTPNLGTPSAVDLSNATALPVATGISGLAANIATWLGSPTSANLRSAMTDETGTGSLVFGTSPTITTPNIVGVSDASNASAGSVGQYVETIVLVGSAVSLSNTVEKTIASISLTAGDWDVSGLVAFTAGATTQITQITGAVSLTNNDLGSQTDSAGSLAFQVCTAGTNWTFASVNVPNLPLVPCRINVSSTTTVYLVARAAFSVSTCAGYGKIIARRRR